MVIWRKHGSHHTPIEPFDVLLHRNVTVQVHILSLSNDSTFGHFKPSPAFLIKPRLLPLPAHYKVGKNPHYPAPVSSYTEPGDNSQTNGLPKTVKKQPRTMLYSIRIPSERESTGTCFNFSINRHFTITANSYYKNKFYEEQ